MTIHASLRSYVFCILWSFILLPFITLPAATKQQPNVLFLAVDDMNDWTTLFDPNNPSSITSSIKQLSDLPSERWLGISENCRNYSEETLSMNKLVSQYEELFHQITSAK